MKAHITQRDLSKFVAEDKPYDVRDTKLVGYLLRVHPTGRKVYYFQYARGKRLKIGTVPDITEKQARERAEWIKAQIMLGGETPEQTRRRDKAHTLKAFIDDHYAPWVSEHRKSGEATLARLRANFLEPMGAKSLPEIIPWLIESWRTKRRKAGIAVTTINRDLGALRAALSKAVEWDILPEHPMKGVRPLKTDKSGSVVRYLSRDEEKRLRSALKARDTRIIQARKSGNAWREARGYEKKITIAGRYGDYLTPMALLSMNTGMRRGEVFSLSWPDINLNEKRLAIAGENAKSGNTRHIPLNREAHAVLTAWGKQAGMEGLVFKGKEGGRLDNIKKSWSKLLKDAEIYGFRWHDLRHHFASRLVMSGADIYVVKELLGHSSITMTEKYAHLAPEHRAATVALLDKGKKSCA